MKMLVGLGNPGKKYEGTRHNIGFDLILELSKRGGLPRFKDKFEAQLAEVPCGGQRLLLVAPQTFMNNSGISVRQVCDFYHIPPADVLVACDDMNLPLGKLRLRTGGSSGGQKGLQSIIQHLRTEEVPRLRLGVGRPAPGRDAADYVLERFHKSELAAVDASVVLGANAVECWCAEGLPTAMNRFNGEARVDEPTKPAGPAKGAASPNPPGDSTGRPPASPR
ncbi:MAG: aminoacyl-tRNA hydrolase [Planctomycetaceae bacterium]|jgi:PTH1 family peptidyl-tRNA hydrolase